MKRSLFLVAFMCVSLIINAQVPQISGYWMSNSGNQFYVEGVNSGFIYKNLATGHVIKAYYVGNNFGFPTFRADFMDGSFQLYGVKSLNEIVTSYSLAPNVVHTWTRANAKGYGRNNNNPQYNNWSSPGSSSSEKKCTVCGGSGWSNSVIYPPNYTGELPSDEWCDICKRSRRPHTHKPCSFCGGTGYK